MSGLWVNAALDGRCGSPESPRNALARSPPLGSRGSFMRKRALHLEPNAAAGWLAGISHAPVRNAHRYPKAFGVRPGEPLPRRLAAGQVRSLTAVLEKCDRVLSQHASTIAKGSGARKLTWFLKGRPKSGKTISNSSPCCTLKPSAKLKVEVPKK